MRQSRPRTTKYRPSGVIGYRIWSAHELRSNDVSAEVFREGRSFFAEHVGLADEEMSQRCRPDSFLIWKQIKRLRHRPVIVGLP
jgi:hypothetical protein